MSQLKLTLRPPPNVDFVHGYPGIPPGTPDRPQASVKGILEVRTPLPIKAKWVRIEFRKIETLPGGGPTNTFHDYVGPSPVGLWSKQEGEEWSLLSSLDYPFSIRIPESIPPSTALENGAGIKYELLASVCTKGKSSFFQKHQSKIITTIASIIIDKHELHSTWPVYSQPETRAVTREGVTLTVERNQTCYGPGDRITVNATVKSDSLYTAILCGFEISLRESTIFRAGPYAAGKKAVPQDRVAIVAENQYSVVATLYEGMYHKLELGCAVSPDHTTTTLNSASHFDITYVVAVRALMGGEHLEMELPVVVSNWVREVSLEAVRRIGPVPSLSLTPSSATNPAMPVDRTAATFNGRARNISFASTISGGGISNAFGAGGVNGAPGHKTLGSKSSFETQSSFDTQSSFFPTLESAEFAIKNAVQEEVGEGSRSNTSQPKPTPSTGPPKNASEAVNLAHVTTEEEKARFERARARAERMQSLAAQGITVAPVSNTPISSPSSATKTSPPLNKPTTTSSKNTPWPTTEEERLHMFNEAQRAVQRKLGLEWPLQVVPVSNTPISSPSSATKTSPLLNKPTTTSSKNTPWPTAEEERLRMFNEAQRAVQRKQGIEWPVVSPYESLLARAGYVEVQSTEADLIQQIFCVFSSVPHNFPTEALAFISPQNWIDARASAIDNNITAVGHLSSYELPLGLIYWFRHSRPANPEYINLSKEIDSSTANILMLKYLVWQPIIMKWLENLDQNTLQLDMIHNMIRLDVLTICAQMLVVTQNAQTCDNFLHQPAQDAQDSLNLLSQLLEFDGLPGKVRWHFTKVLTHLSSASKLYPECLTLRLLDPGQWVDGGGFADVYKGVLSSGQVVSIKRPRIPLWKMGGFLKSWSREIILWSQLSHPNILPLYGIYYIDDPHGSPVCMISPWMEHGNIVQFLKGPPEHINRLALIQDISCGIQYLHQNSIIHGDLKGANILVTAMHRACIADFGLSAIAASQFPIMSSSKSSNQGGTMPWQAPETIRYPNPMGNTRESDMYAFACVCCEVFTGKPPFCETENLRELLIRNMVLAGERPKRPASSELTNALWDCMVDCWKHNHNERPTVEETVQRLSAMPELYGLDRSNSDTEWDKSAFARRLRSSLRENPLLPTMEQLQMLLSGARRSSTPVSIPLDTGSIYIS